MDESLATEALNFELQTDILTLLENVKCQGNNPFGLKQALLALANIFSSDCASQEYFYLTGGVEELQKLLLEGNCPLSVVPAALYCLACAVRQNVTSQKAVLTERMFSLIHELLSHSNSSDRLLQSAAFLLACSVAGSNKGQLLAAETGCLQDLVNLLRDFMATGSEDENTWSSVIRAIGVCVNNPQNAHNQQVCCSMLPHTLKFVSTETRHTCLGHVFTLISSVVANNGPNQNRIRRCGGIEMLMNFIRQQVGVEMTPLSLNLLVSAVSAVNACIADNEDCGVQAGTLGLVQILLDLLQTNNLELNQTQVFIITLAHVLESSNDYCQLVNEGKGYYTLVNYLTDCQDDELFKVIKYILTLCKTQGANEPSDGQRHNDVHDKDYDDNLKQSKRDLTAFLKEGFTELSNQLGSIEKASECIQWMTDVNRSAQPAVGSFKPPIDTPGNHSNIDQTPPHYRIGENIVQWSRQDCMPGKNSLNSDRKGQEIDTSQNNSFASDMKKKSDNGIRQFVQNSFLGNSVYTDSNRIVRSRDKIGGLQDRIVGPHNVGVEMIKCSKVDSECKHVHDGGIGNHMKPSHRALTQAQKSYSPASSNPHRSNTGRSEQAEHLNGCQGLSKHTNRMTDSKISQIHSQKHWNIKHDHDFQMHKEGRSSSHCEELSNSACLEDQVSYQMHGYQGVDSGNTVTSPWSVKGTRRQNSIDGKQRPYEKKITLCPDVQDCCDGKHAVTNCSPRRMKIGQQNYEISESMQSPVLGQQPCKHRRERNDSAHKHIAHVQKAQDSCGCERSCDRNVHPHLSASNARYTITHSTPKSSSSCTQLQHFPDVQITPELPTEQILEVNKKRNHQPEDNFKASVAPHENQLNLLSQLQKVMSDLFKSLLPGHVISLRKSDSHSSPAGQPSVEQCQNISEIVGPCLSPCQSFLSLCGDGDVQDQDQHQEMSHTTTKEALVDQVSGLKNITVSLQPDSGSLSEIQKDDNSQAISACSNCENDCSVRDNTVDCNDQGTISGKAASNKTVDENKIFIKPSQPHYVPRTTVNHKATVVVSNTRLAGTPGTPLTTHAPHKTPLQPGHQPPVSPALSLFDSQLRSMAFRNTTGVAAGLENTFSQKSDNSTSGFESTCSAEAISNMAPALSSPESQVDGHTCETYAALNQGQSSGIPSSQFPASTKQKNFSLHQHSLKFVNSQQPFNNQLSHTQSPCFTDSGGNKRKSATLIKKRMHEKKKANLAGCSPQYSKDSSCPGCCAGLKLNSCTYNIAIEANRYTCAYHRHVRQCERTYISQLLPSKQTLSVPKKGSEDNMRVGADAAHDIYEFQSSSEEHMKRTSVRQQATSKQQNGEMGRRSRVAYTEQEVLNLLEAVDQMGKHWQQILWTYQFHPSRTAVDLKDKYKQLQTKESKQTTAQLPFSLCEIRRLKNGVKQLGYNWQAILRSYKFLPGRTASDLHTKWRSLNTVESFSDGVDS